MLDIFSTTKGYLIYMNLEAATNLKAIQLKIQEANVAIEAQRNSCITGDRKSLEAFETAMRQHASRLADWIAAEQLQQLLIREDLNFRVQEMFAKRGLKHGTRTINIRMSGGNQIPFVASYWITYKDDKRKKHNRGFYPALLLLGIYDHCSPLLLAEIAQLCVALGSMEEAQRLLEERGIGLDIKTIRNAAKRFSRRARIGQKHLSHMIFADDQLKGHRVVISMDGGRLRTRKKKRGPKTEQGRSHYKTDWREPKLLIIYVVGENGRIDKKFSPIIDGSLGGPKKNKKILMK